MSALFKMDQPTAIPPLVGTFGVATRDVTSGVQVIFTAQDIGHSSYDWEVISQPRDSMVPGPPVTITPTPGSPWIGTATFNHAGGYLVRLTVDASLVTEDASVLYMGIPLANSGLAVPALNETLFDNSEDSPAYRGWEDKIDAFFKWIDANVGSAPPPFLRAAGNPNGVVSGVAGQFYYDTSGDALYVCILAGTGSWRVV